MIAGVDGTKSGWIAAIERGDGHICLEAFQEFAELSSRKDIQVIVIDVPIGLLHKGIRKADEAARKLLKNRACCVFTAPIRPILHCATRQITSDEWQAIEGKRCTKQLWGIIHKIREVDETLQRNPRLRKKVYEGHPEVSFAIANGGCAIQQSKDDPAGRSARLNVLGKGFKEEADAWLKRKPRFLHEDIVDAFAMLWTAKRVGGGSYLGFPEGAGENASLGMKAQIVA